MGFGCRTYFITGILFSDSDHDAGGVCARVEHDHVCAEQHVAEDDAGEALGCLLHTRLLDCFHVPAAMIMLHYFIAGKKTRCRTISQREGSCCLPNIIRNLVLCAVQIHEKRFF